ncbi:MAG: hypothetical protein WC659_04620 [Patescibacteria group bacterium]
MLHQRVVLHIDMNSYFASVEQQANPFLRGRAVAVCAYLSPNGCVIASSREAKEKGVKTGLRVRDARSLYPPTIFLQNDPIKYRTTTEAIFGIFAEYSDRIEPYSIDEAFIDLTGYAADLKHGAEIGREINRRIKEEVGEWLRSSVGIAETRFIAKLASDTGPKDSVTVLPSSQLASYLKTISLRDIWGIAGGLERRLASIGITSPLRFRQVPMMHILSSLGKPGYYLWASLNGIELNGVAKEEEHTQKSIGHSYCLPKKTNDPKTLAAILMKLCEKTGRRLRAARVEAWNISVGRRCENPLAFHQYPSPRGRSIGKNPPQLARARPLDAIEGRASEAEHGRAQERPMRVFSTNVRAPLFDSFDIFREAWRLLKADTISSPVSMLAVSVSRLMPPSAQFSLFPCRRGGSRRVACALDAINDRWGEYTVMRGAMWHTQKNAPDRIGYRKSTEIPKWRETIQSIPLAEDAE